MNNWQNSKKELIELAQNCLKNEDDGVFMYSATKPDKTAMQSLGEDQQHLVRQILDEMLEDTRRHERFFKELITHLKEKEVIQ